MYFDDSCPIRIISRPKLSGFGVGDHWGVQLPNGNVAHLTPGRGEALVSYAEFAQGLPVKEIRRIPLHLHAETIGRVIQSVSAPGQYHAIDRNCQTYANWLVGAKPESPTVQALTILSVVALAWKLAA